MFISKYVVFYLWPTKEIKSTHGLTGRYTLLKISCIQTTCSLAGLTKMQDLKMYVIRNLPNALTCLIHWHQTSSNLR